MAAQKSRIVRETSYFNTARNERKSGENRKGWRGGSDDKEKKRALNAAAFCSEGSLSKRSGRCVKGRLGWGRRVWVERSRRN